MPFTTEFSFTLPRGYLDAAGQTHRDGLADPPGGAGDQRSLAVQSEIHASPLDWWVIVTYDTVTRFGLDKGKSA